ncbi:MAG: HAMP domain-containing histidine kinase [Bacteroidales bacterium]|jgi:two-component system phosphate regulon sensor histidine kinase PhoR|nr:HAMP domain-containing histidine kinase [Bacteroidales bacterium]
MSGRFKVVVCLIVVAIIVLLFMQFLWINRMFKAEQKYIKTQATTLLKNNLATEIKRLSIDRQELVEAGLLNPYDEGHGGSYDERTVTLYIAYPEKKKIVRQCKTIEEWYEYSNPIYPTYHYIELDINRLDSLFKTSLEECGITLPFVLEKTDRVNNIIESSSGSIDYSNFKLTTDTIELGIDDKDYLLACFDGSYYGRFKQMRAILFVSFAIVCLLIVIMLFFVRTIFYQKKISELRTDMINSIVHDLKNPVVYLKKILPRIKTDESQQKYIEAARRKNERLSLLIEKLLVASLDKGRLTLDNKEMSVCDIVSDIVDQYRIDNESLNISFLCKSGTDMALVDKLHFSNAVINLIDNAIKYSENNPDIIVRCYNENDYICISIKDHGIGIPREYIKNIFEKNFRVPEHKSLPRYGFGIGLSYVKLIIEALNGKVKVKSEYKKGSEFVIMIPVL